jgi:acyl-CoA hydrolase/rubrerythrin
MSKSITGSHTEELLKKAFQRELNAQALYLYYADSARKQGQPRVAEIFEAIAANEAEHARHEFNYLGGAPDMIQNIENAIEREFNEAKSLYPDTAVLADNEGFPEIAAFFNRLAKVEEKHGTNLQTVFDSLNKPGLIKGKTSGHSAIQMAQMMMPNQANPVGFVHGGELMKLMDNAAAVVALRHSQNLVATAEVEDIIFKSPVHVGELVVVNARITFTSHSTMEVQIIATAENTLTAERRPAFSSHYIFVAIDAAGKTVEVPPLIVITEEEAELYSQGLARYEARKQKNK